MPGKLRDTVNRGTVDRGFTAFIKDCSTSSDGGSFALVGDEFF